MSLNKELKILSDVMDSRFFKSLSEPVRIEIMKILIVNEELDVNALSEKLPQDRSVISRHLSGMSEVGLLKFRKEGRHLYYSIDSEEVIKKFEHILDSIKRCVTY